jgi:hypothetical protein
MKRQAYYFKQGYHIKYTNNTKYFRDIWKTRDDDASAKKGKSPFAGTTTAVSASVPIPSLTNSNYPPKVSANPFGPFVKPKPKPTVASFFKMKMTTTPAVLAGVGGAAAATPNTCRIEL